jgi:hypothetical protein
MLKNFVRIGRMLYTISILYAHAKYARGIRHMHGTHTLAFQRIFVRMKIISLIFIRFSYVSLIRNSVTGPLQCSDILTELVTKVEWHTAALANVIISCA